MMMHALYEILTQSVFHLLEPFSELDGFSFHFDNNFTQNFVSEKMVFYQGLKNASKGLKNPIFLDQLAWTSYISDFILAMSKLIFVIWC